MATIDDLALACLDRLEESRSAPVFWSKTLEIYPYISEAMNEATLITGEPQIFSGTPLAVTASQTLQSMPTNALALLKLEGAAGTIKKVSVWDLDQLQPSWENDTGTVPTYWFPAGLGQWGVYPKMTSPINLAATFVGIPVAMAFPFTGSETVPFQAEYLEAFAEYGAHVARLKEATQEFFDGMKELDRFLAKCSELSKFGDRIGILRFSRAQGSAGAVTPVVNR